jgi:hypothetical protein
MNADSRAIIKHILSLIISKVGVGNVFIFYHIVLIEILDFKNSTWQLIHTTTLVTA